MKLACIVFATVASLAVLAPLAECHPAIEISGFGDALSEAEDLLQDGLRVKFHEGADPSDPKNGSSGGGKADDKGGDKKRS